MRVLLLSTVLLAGVWTLPGLTQQPAPPTSGVNPAKKGAPVRAGSATSKSTVAAPQETLPVVAPANALATPKLTPPVPGTNTLVGTEKTPKTPAATAPVTPAVVTTPDPKNAAAVAKHRLRKSYAYGIDIARAIQADEMDFDLAQLIQGLSDGLNKKKITITEDEYAQLMMAITKEAEEKALAKFERQSEENKKEGEKFLGDNAKKEGIVTIAGGVQYRVLKAGDGKSPRASDTVQVHLKGMLLNGDQFFSSYSLNQPSTFPVRGVIRGLKDALVQMKIGDKWQIFIPAEHAFGKEGNTPAAPGLPGVGPNEVVIYEIELIDIVPEAQE